MPTFSQNVAFIFGLSMFLASTASAECVFEVPSLGKSGQYYLIEREKLNGGVEEGIIGQDRAKAITADMQPAFSCNATDVAGVSHQEITGRLVLTPRAYSKVTCNGYGNDKGWEPFSLPASSPFRPSGGCRLRLSVTPWEKALMSRFMLLLTPQGTLAAFDNINRSAIRSDGVNIEPAGIFAQQNPFHPHCGYYEQETLNFYGKMDLFTGLGAPLFFGEIPYFKNGSLWTNKKNAYIVPTESASSQEQCKKGAQAVYKAKVLTTYQVLDTIFLLAKRKPLAEYFAKSDVEQLSGTISSDLVALGLKAFDSHRKWVLLSYETEGPYYYSEDSESERIESIKPNF